MAQKGSGYNNPAFCNQFDSSLYDYEYVPEIDPDSPNIERKTSYRPTTQRTPWNPESTRDSSPHRNNLDELSNSDESNGSVVVEERNNRRVTMICEKRGPIRDADGGYAHDISLESNPDEEDNQRGFVPVERHNRTPTIRADRGHTIHYYPDYNDVRTRQQMAERHRYKELDLDQLQKIIPVRPTHRYAVIDDPFEAEGIRFVLKKPRAASPPPEYQRHPSTPVKNHQNYNIQRTPSPIRYKRQHESSGYDHYPENLHTSSPIQHPNEFELSNLSPSRRFDRQRESPIGAPNIQVSDPSFKPANSASSRNLNPDVNFNSPSKPTTDKRHLLTPQRSPKIVPIRKEDDVKRSKVRRNISSSFYEHTSPYRPTTQTIVPRNTAVITPILQRKFSELTRDKMTRQFQSTGNVLKVDNFKIHPRFDFTEERAGRITRNRSVPNFQQDINAQKRTPVKARQDVRIQVSPSYAHGSGIYSSPSKSPERFSPMNKSRTSLLDNLKASWSNLGSDPWTPSPGCLTFAALLQLVCGFTSCTICFYLLSLLGRRYYLDLGMLSGFVSFILGALGFRSHRWRWLPHRNYVTGYFVLAVFSFLTASSLVFIITVRPMSGDPMLDVTAGAICAISVIIIVFSMTGLTLSGCCKTPPPDNRVTCA